MEAPRTPFGFLPVEVIREKTTTEQWDILMEHALCFACLDGNVFGVELTEQYIPEAYANLWANGLANENGRFPNLYPSKHSETWIAALPPSHAQYADMDDETREEILSHFLVDPRGNARNLVVIVEKATDVLGSHEKAMEWVDHFSATLDDNPRALSSTTEGTNKVLIHLGDISRHGHDA